jgi:hypothetical protein
MKPWKRGARLRVPPLGYAKGPKLLLGHTDVENPFLLMEILQAPLSLVIFTLTRLEAHHLQGVLLGKLVNVRHKCLAHRRHQGGGSDERATMLLEEGRYPTTGLQHGLIGIEIEAIDTFNVQSDLIFQQLTQILVYHNIGSGWQLGVSPSCRLFGYDRSLLLLMTNRGHFMTRRSEAMPR